MFIAFFLKNLCVVLFFHSCCCRRSLCIHFTLHWFAWKFETFMCIVKITVSNFYRRVELCVYLFSQSKDNKNWQCLVYLFFIQKILVGLICVNSVVLTKCVMCCIFLQEYHTFVMVLCYRVQAASENVHSIIAMNKWIYGHWSMFLCMSWCLVSLLCDVQKKGGNSEYKWNILYIISETAYILIPLKCKICR